MNECIPAILVGNNAPFVAHSLKSLGVADGPVRGLPCAGPLGPAFPIAKGESDTLTAGHQAAMRPRCAAAGEAAVIIGIVMIAPRALGKRGTLGGWHTAPALTDPFWVSIAGAAAVLGSHGSSVGRFRLLGIRHDL